MVLTKNAFVLPKEGNIMIRVASLFSQLLGEFPRMEFARLVARHDAERNAKGFSCWTQFVAMLFCQLGRAESLREICNGLRCCMGKLVHLGIMKGPNKSTLSYANEHRPAGLYQDLFYTALAHFQGQIGMGCRKKKFRFKNKLLSLDSTTVSLCLALFPWAKFRRAKGGVKVHVLLDHDIYMPSFVHITDAQQHDVRAAYLVPLAPNSIVAMDRGYTDYRLFGEWTESRVYFVTRLKENASYSVVKRREIPKNGNILSDEDICLTSHRAEEECPYQLRRIEVWDPRNARVIVLLTNHLEFAATTIAVIYKDRWEIELFFKALKQNLKIKTFVGTSENALRIQIWTALIAILLLKWLHHISTFRWCFSNLVALLCLNLFTYRDLREWLHKPMETDPVLPRPEQLTLPLSDFGQVITAQAR